MIVNVFFLSRTMLVAVGFACLFVISETVFETNCVAKGAEPDRFEFFESHIRPVLVERCYSCHNSSTDSSGGFALDARVPLLAGGDLGAVIVPGKPAESRLLAILRHEIDGLKMPKNSGKLDAETVNNFSQWILDGAPDPREKAPSANEIASVTSWEATLNARKKWWSFQPIRNPETPIISDGSASQHPIDCFVLEQLLAAKIQPATEADPHSLVRRTFFALLGIPPSPEEIHQWTKTLKDSKQFELLVDHLLARPEFGERWARHWMDWIRYADTHGSEGDPEIQGTSHYRDYLIRAMNADVPIDQLIREHIAGDLLKNPRLDPTGTINESAIGPAHWRMVFHGYAPTDALDEKVRFIDDQIAAFSKAFLGLTVSCARCHDHKFDPVSQRDYYAMFGILGSCRPGRTLIDAPDVLGRHREELRRKKPEIRTAVAGHWSRLMPDVGTRMNALVAAADTPTSLLHLFNVIGKDVDGGMSFEQALDRQQNAWRKDHENRLAFAGTTRSANWNFSQQEDVAEWFENGNATTPVHPSSVAGDFSVAAEGDGTIATIVPAGIYSNMVSNKHALRLTSPTIDLDENTKLWVQSIGDGGAAVRYVVQNFPRNGPNYSVTRLTREWKWQAFDLTYWSGDDIHIELATAPDAPLPTDDDARSWFGVRNVVLQKKDQPAPSEALEALDGLFEEISQSPPRSVEELNACFVRALLSAVTRWSEGKARDTDALLLDASVRQNILENRLSKMTEIEPLVQEYRKLESDVIVPTRVPGLDETIACDQALFERGDHKKPAAVVPRRFLEMIDATPYQTVGSGREKLAEDILRSDNPLTARVLSNRIWHHLFGRGIVATPDNLGRLGERPTHPELLDHLAHRLRSEGWSLKQFVRSVVISRTWKTDSFPSEVAKQIDPENRLLSHAFVRRLEAEAIRDSVLMVSGALNRTQFGPSVDGSTPRRSVYVRVARNSLDPFLRTFDFPEPFSATGRRDDTNVPAQSLVFLNDPRIAALSGQWAAAILADQSLATDEQRIEQMILSAIGRPPRSGEVTRFKELLASTRQAEQHRTEELLDLDARQTALQLIVKQIMDPLRQALESTTQQSVLDARDSAPTGIARWEFADNLQDSIGTAHGTAHAGARLNAKSLHTTGQGYVVTAPLGQSIREKTLEAWVQLDSLTQRGGGAITIQTPDGHEFDSIVFGEQVSGEWLAGSNFFARTKSFGGPVEADAMKGPVHLAVTYSADGTISGYRNGIAYGESYKASKPVEFIAGQAVVSFAIRHLPAGENKMLQGRISRAQVFDRALSAKEIGLLYKAGGGGVPDEDVFARLEEKDQQKVLQIRSDIANIEHKRASLRPLSATTDPSKPWSEIARVLFMFKEFIYLR